MEEIEIKPTNAFTERFAEGASIGTSGGGLIILDFLKPEVSLMGEKMVRLPDTGGNLDQMCEYIFLPRLLRSFVMH